MIILFGHKDIANTTVIRLQLQVIGSNWIPRYSKVVKNCIRLSLRKSSCDLRFPVYTVSSCDLVQSGLVVFSSPYL